MAAPCTAAAAGWPPVACVTSSPRTGLFHGSHAALAHASTARWLAAMSVHAPTGLPPHHPPMQRAGWLRRPGWRLRWRVRPAAASEPACRGIGHCCCAACCCIASLHGEQSLLAAAATLAVCAQRHVRQSQPGSAPRISRHLPTPFPLPTPPLPCLSLCLQLRWRLPGLRRWPLGDSGGEGPLR